MSKAIREQKDFAFEVKEFDDVTGIVKGYLSTFNNIDEGGDRVLPGAFKRTLQSKYQYKKAHNKTYLMPLLWQHDTNSPIGGYTEAKEDNVGLYVEFQVDMDVQRGKEAYSGLKKGYIFQQSIGYDVINAEYVKEADGSMVRDLLELRLWEGSVVTFPMNTEAVVTSVKSLETKTVCGDTSLPIGPRNEAWDGSKAKKQIFDYAAKEDGTIDASKAKKCFLQVDGDTSLKGSYGYPFCYVENGSPRISVGGVKACAGALSGSRGASTGGSDVAGMQRKVATMYKRINKAYPDDPELTPPWSDGGKARGNRRMERKTFAEHYNDEMAQDLLEDWQDVYVCALTCAIFDAFTIGDQPESDISQALDDFKETVLSKFVAQGVECGLSDYLEDHGYSYTPGLNTMQNGSDDGKYGYMSRSDRMDRKAGKPISAANQKIIDDHVKSVKAMAKKAKADMQAHTDAMHDAIDNMSGGGKSLGTPSFKVGRPMSADNADKMRDLTDKAMAIVQDHTKALHKAANGLANAVKPPVSDTDGEDPTDDEDQQAEKSLQDALKELKALAV